MRQHGNYADSGVNPMMAAQMHHMAAQKSQHNPGVNQFPGREGSLRAEDERQYIPKAEGQWQWDREASKPSNSLPSHMLDEGQGSEPSRPLYQGHRSESKLVLDKQTNKDLEIGYDDNNLPLTFDGLEQKFLQDFLKLTKEQQDAEDIENARHRERLSEINTQYQEKILTMRARQATQREEFLCKESQVRHQQYQQACMSNYPHNAGSNEAHGLGSASGPSSVIGDAHRAYPASHFDSYGERPDYPGGSRGRGYKSRGPYPGGRAYNSGGRYF
ncbi:hypothetical protein IHE45_08G126700 [Dioscorea alata]|nr:hypothetical protein IHE45_08G126700 [Dioscorea alata]KAH7675292.1 hypothetical protein IHE45_08G126700 [Dioscorea alata]KAH7675297.1 hypothetical protein IHE45_08G126700 [Dioscorea alata]